MDILRRHRYPPQFVLLRLLEGHAVEPREPLVVGLHISIDDLPVHQNPPAAIGALGASYQCWASTANRYRLFADLSNFELNFTEPPW